MELALTKINKMKVYIENIETVLGVGYTPKVKDAKQGDIIPHQKLVYEVYFYQKIDDDKFQKITLAPQMIKEIYEKIQEQESQIVDLPFDELPF